MYHGRAGSLSNMNNLDLKIDLEFSRFVLIMVGERTLFNMNDLDLEFGVHAY